MDKILARVVELENQGYQFEAAEGVVRPAGQEVRRHVPPALRAAELPRQRRDRRRRRTSTTEATVKLRVGGEVRHEVAEGDGPVNALDAALRKALDGDFPNLAEMHLVDYKVRVINSEAGTAAGVRVVIESRDEDDVWGTVGVSENIIEASWIALVDSIEYKLCKDEGQERRRRKPRSAEVANSPSIR